MADSYLDFGVDGDLSGTQLNNPAVFSSLTLDYIASSHIGVTHTTAAGVKTVLSSSNFAVTGSPGAFTVTINSGVTLPLAAADQVRITRATPVSSLERTFADGSVLKASDLNTQNKQALFGIQEQVDGGLGSLPIDTDDKYNAGSRVIKNLGTPANSTDAVTKDYVDNVSIYGGAFGDTSPQYWTFTTSGGDKVNGNADRAYTLSSPTASSDNDNMFLVEVGGVVQSPAAYNVTEATGVYTLTLIGGGTEIDNGISIIVRNFGVARNLIQQPYQNPDASTAAIIIRQLNSETTANLQEWQDHTSTVKAKVEVDGDATFVDITADDISSATVTTTGNASIGGTANVVGNTTVNTDKVVINAADGNTTIAGTLGVTGAATLSGGISGNTTVSGNLTTQEIAASGDVNINTDKLNIVAETGNLTTAGAITSTGIITSQSSIVAPGGSMTGEIAMNANKITGLATPSAGSTDAATAAYAESITTAKSGHLAIMATGTFTTTYTTNQVFTTGTVFENIVGDAVTFSLTGSSSSTKITLAFSGALNNIGASNYVFRWWPQTFSATHIFDEHTSGNPWRLKSPFGTITESNDKIEIATPYATAGGYQGDEYYGLWDILALTSAL